MGQHQQLAHSWKPDLFSLITVTDIYRVISLCHVGLNALHVFSKVWLRAQPLGDPSCHPESWASLLCCLQQVVVLVRAPVFHLMNGPNVPCPTLKGFNEWIHDVLRKGTTASYFASLQKLPEARCSVQVVYLRHSRAVWFAISPRWGVFLHTSFPDCSHPWRFNTTDILCILHVLYLCLGSIYKESKILFPTPPSNNQLCPLEGNTQRYWECMI